MSGTGEVAPSGRTLLLGAAEQSDVKRVEEEARWATVGYASTADLSQAEDQLRSEVEAADAAALQAAIDAAAASDEAGVALYEAQTGSVAVGRLLAGSLAVNQYVESTGYDPGYAGWHIDADGSVEFNNAIFRGAIESTDITGGTITSTSLVTSSSLGSTDAIGVASASGIIIVSGAPSNPYHAAHKAINFLDGPATYTSSIQGTIGADGSGVTIASRTRTRIGAMSITGSYASISGATVLHTSNHNHNQGWRTSYGTTWNNGTGKTGDGTGTGKTGGWHKHQTDGHTHQVYI